MTYVDPSKFDPLFPDRPITQDFIDLSNAAQAIDNDAEEGETIESIMGLDGASTLYFIRQRFGIFSQKTAGAIRWTSNNYGIYLDALAVGKTLAEQRAAKDAALLDDLEKWFADPDQPINGGDLVEYVGELLRERTS